MINLDKTTITFTPNIHGDKTRENCTILGVVEVYQHSKHLCLPTLVGKSKPVLSDKFK